MKQFGLTADVFRAPDRDRFGDPVDSHGNPVNITDKEGNAYIGTLTNVVPGSPSATRTNDRQESADGRKMFGFLGSQSPTVQFGDRLVVNGQKYEAISDPNWGTPHSMTGTVFPRYWVDVLYRR